MGDEPLPCCHDNQAFAKVSVMPTLIQDHIWARACVCVCVCVCWVGGEKGKKKKRERERDKDAWQKQTSTHAVQCMSMHVCEADITFILHQFLHVVYTPRCNKQKIRKERNGEKKKQPSDAEITAERQMTTIREIGFGLKIANRYH